MQLGYDTERRNVNGKTGSVLVPSNTAKGIQIMFEKYAENDTSLRDVIDFLRDNNIKLADDKNHYNNLCRARLSKILNSAVYVRADKEVYKFFASQGYEMMDESKETLINRFGKINFRKNRRSLHFFLRKSVAYTRFFLR